ncbi:MAG: amidohydrolase family protein [Oscillospiraceae bacterium]|nr:amidohydrolase family protein [Oscillospiraceae bacterium]
MEKFVLKGDICYSTDTRTLQTAEAAYLVCVDGKSAGVFETLPEQYQDLPLIDCSGQLIMPGLVDLHVHAPQFAFRSLGMDLELIDWLNTHTFPEESKYADMAYAFSAYLAFVGDIQRGPNTRSVIFATRHVPATVLLMDLLEESGLSCMVGKVNMDRHAPEPLVETSAAQSLADTRTWLSEVAGRYSRVSPILTPRFIPSCTDELMAGLGEIHREFGLPVQSHLSENKSEIDWVGALRPEAESYGHAYYRNGLFGGDVPTVMAHCVWPTAEEFALIKQQQIRVAHCPQSNINLSSGIAPIRRYLDAGVPVGLGSDVAGGANTSIFRAMSDAIGVSKLYWRLIDQDAAPLTLEEAFYLGTLGGGRFFGEVGSFAPGFEFDALVIDDRSIPGRRDLEIADRLARVVYLSDERHIVRKFVQGAAVALGT